MHVQRTLWLTGVIFLTILVLNCTPIPREDFPLTTNSLRIKNDANFGNSSLTEADNERLKKLCPEIAVEKLTQVKINRQTGECVFTTGNLAMDCGGSASFQTDKNDKIYGSCECYDSSFYVYSTKLCRYIFQKDSCEEGQWLTIGRIPGQMVCEPHPCWEEQKKQRYVDSKLWFKHNGTCLRQGSTLPPCLDNVYGNLDAIDIDVDSRSWEIVIRCNAYQSTQVGKRIRKLCPSVEAEKLEYTGIDRATKRCIHLKSCGENAFFEIEHDDPIYGSCKCDSSYLYDNGTKECRQVFRQDNCMDGEWLTLGTKHGEMICEPNPCIEDQRKQWHGLDYSDPDRNIWFKYNGSCIKTGSTVLPCKDNGGGKVEQIYIDVDFKLWTTTTPCFLITLADREQRLKSLCPDIEIDKLPSTYIDRATNKCVLTQGQDRIDCGQLAFFSPDENDTLYGFCTCYDSLVYKNETRTCHNLFEQDNCMEGEWLTLGKTPGELICELNPCIEAQRKHDSNSGVRFVSNGTCVNAGSMDFTCQRRDYQRPIINFKVDILAWKIIIVCEQDGSHGQGGPGEVPPEKCKTTATDGKCIKPTIL